MANGEVKSNDLEVKVVEAINAVVNEVAADIFKRNYDAEKIVLARDSGQYVVLFEGVRRRIGQEIYKRGGISKNELAELVLNVVKPWQDEIRHTTEMNVIHTADPDEYEMEYWRKDKPEDRLIKRGIPGNQTSATLDNLESGQWLVRIRGRNKAGPGPWSETTEVTVK